MECVAEVLHERDVGAGRKPEPESVAKREREVAITVQRAEPLSRIPRAKVSELDDSRRHLDDLMQPRTAAGVKERLQPENVSVRIA